MWGDAVTDERRDFDDQDEGRPLFERLRDDERQKAKKLKDQLERGLSPRSRQSEQDDPSDPPDDQANGD